MVSRLELREGVYVITGRHPAPGIDVTSTIVSSHKSALAFDSLCYPEDTRGLLRTLKDENTNLTTLVNTHWHLDHTAGNQLLNTHTVTHAKFVELMKTELVNQLRGSKEVVGEDVTVKPPHQTFDKKLQLRLENRQLTLLHLPGHTPDSIAGYLEQERILIAGDCVMELPYIFYGSSTDLIESLRIIEKMDLDTIIQGHGGPCNKAKVEEDRKYVEDVRKVVGEGIQSDKPLDELREIPLDTFLTSERIKQMPAIFKDHIHKENMAKVHAELTSSSKGSLIPVRS